MPRTFRSTEELAAVALEKLRAIQFRAAKEQALKDPKIAALFSARDDIMREKRAAQVILGDGPQGAAARIQLHQDWITDIEKKKAEAVEILENCNSELNAIEQKIEQAVNNRTVPL